MKKQTIVMVLGIALLALFFAGCKSKPDAVQETKSGVPEFVRKALRDASEDVLIGVGSYKGEGGSAKTYAETRARADISRQLNTVIKNMITDYDARSEQDAKAVLAFQESITEALSKSTLSGSRTEDFDTIDGTTWAVVSYSKSLAAREVLSASQAAARLAPSAAAAFDAKARMNNAFDEIAGGKGSVPVTE